MKNVHSSLLSHLYDLYKEKHNDEISIIVQYIMQEVGDEITEESALKFVEFCKSFESVCYE